MRILSPHYWAVRFAEGRLPINAYYPTYKLYTHFASRQSPSPVPSTRPVTASGPSAVAQDSEGDLYIKYKKLQKQLEFLQVGVNSKQDCNPIDTLEEVRPTSSNLPCSPSSNLPWSPWFLSLPSPAFSTGSPHSSLLPVTSASHLLTLPPPLCSPSYSLSLVPLPPLPPHPPPRSKKTTSATS